MSAWDITLHQSFNAQFSDLAIITSTPAARGKNANERIKTFYIRATIHMTSNQVMKQRSRALLL